MYLHTIHRVHVHQVITNSSADEKIPIEFLYLEKCYESIEKSCRRRFK